MKKNITIAVLLLAVLIGQITWYLNQRIITKQQVTIAKQQIALAQYQRAHETCMGALANTTDQLLKDSVAMDRSTKQLTFCAGILNRGGR